MSYRDDTSPALYAAAHPAQERGTYHDPHDGGRHDPTHRISLAAILTELRTARPDVARLDQMLGRATSPELVAVAEAALLVIASRGGPEAEAANGSIEADTPVKLAGPSEEE